MTPTEACELLIEADAAQDNATRLTFMADEILTAARQHPNSDPRHLCGTEVARSLREAANSLHRMADIFRARASEPVAS